jgi:hypothetical protein
MVSWLSKLNLPDPEQSNELGVKMLAFAISAIVAVSVLPCLY